MPKSEGGVGRAQDGRNQIAMTDGDRQAMTAPADPGKRRQTAIADGVEALPAMQAMVGLLKGAFDLMKPIRSIMLGEHAFLQAFVQRTVIDARSAKGAMVASARR